MTAFTGQKEEVKRYEKPLIIAEKAGIWKNFCLGASLGFVFMIMYFAYGLAFWYGAKLVITDGLTIGRMLLVFFGIIMGAAGLGSDR